MSNRYNQNENFVSPGVPPPSTAIQRVEPQPIEVPTNEQSPDIVKWKSTSATRDSSGAEDRAKGINIRFKPVVALTSLLSVLASVVVGNALPIVIIGEVLDKLLIFLFFMSTSSVFALVALNVLDYKYSQGGIEMYKVDKTFELHSQHQAQLHELRRDAIKAQIEMMRRDYEKTNQEYKIIEG